MSQMKNFYENVTEALDVLANDTIPHENEAWQQIVVSLAYNAITSPEPFRDVVEVYGYDIKRVQSMLDLAVGAVLQNPNFRLTGFREITPN